MYQMGLESSKNTAKTLSVKTQSMVITMTLYISDGQGFVKVGVIPSLAGDGFGGFFSDENNTKHRKMY